MTMVRATMVGIKQLLPISVLTTVNVPVRSLAASNLNSRFECPLRCFGHGTENFDCRIGPDTMNLDLVLE